MSFRANWSLIPVSTGWVLQSHVNCRIKSSLKNLLSLQQSNLLGECKKYVQDCSYKWTQRTVLAILQTLKCKPYPLVYFMIDYLGVIVQQLTVLWQPRAHRLGGVLCVRTNSHKRCRWRRYKGLPRYAQTRIHNRLSSLVGNGYVILLNIHKTFECVRNDLRALSTENTLQSTVIVEMFASDKYFTSWSALSKLKLVGGTHTTANHE